MLFKVVTTTLLQKSFESNPRIPQKMYTGRGRHRTYFVGVGTPHNIYRKSLAVGGWVAGGPNQEIIPLRGSILQAETCQILSLADNPRWSPSVAIL